MMWWRALFLLIFSYSAAQAQLAGPGIPGQADHYNSSGTVGYQIRGLNAIRVPSNSTSNAFAVIGGPLSANSAASNLQFLTTLGAYTMESYSGPSINEGAAIGMGAGISQTTAAGGLYIGTSSGASETTAAALFICGADCGRDMVDTGGSIGIGSGTLEDGIVSGSNIAIGMNVLPGNDGIITVAGTPHAGDTYPFTFTTANPCSGAQVNCTLMPGGGSTYTMTYTVQATDTTAAILASSLATFLSSSGIDYRLGDGYSENSHNLFGVGWQIADASYPTLIKGHIPGNWQITTTAGTCTGTCAATTTVSGPFTGTSNLIIGNTSFGFFGATTLNNVVSVGIGNAADTATTINNSALLGNDIIPNATTASYIVAAGVNALTDCITCSQEIAIGSKAGYQVTGGRNTIVSDETVAGQGCITSGSTNLELAYGACVPSPTANYQISIQNAIWGANNQGTGSTASTGAIGIEEQPAASTYASSWLGGEVVVGLGSALTTSGTAGFLHLPFTTAAPTGTPANILGNACEINTATETINCYIGSSWYHITLSSNAG